MFSGLVVFADLFWCGADSLVFGISVNNVVAACFFCVCGFYFICC